ncbi:MAG: serine/threonine-protein phosphatase [Gammaproteobacteria bacterium]|nr:serine/threonine-protein phosphatase [Gammaproteobacteria bacterium]
MNTHPLHWQSTHRSNKGLVRQINEDACLNRPEVGIWVVADGMGGHAAGDLASRTIVDTLQGMEPGESLGLLANGVKQRLFEVNQKLLQESEKRGGETIGSTVVALLAHQGRCIYLWAGDSRIYLYRRGRFKQLSRDHSQVEELIAQGIVSHDQADSCPISNYITRAVGAYNDLELDAEMIEPRTGDIFLLCSDGLYKEIADDEIASVLGQFPLQEAAEHLLALSLERGARDNVTFVLVNCFM